MLPGTQPPTSIRWPNIEAKPTSSPSWNTGTSTIQSLMWLMAPPHLYGSLCRMTSPGSRSNLLLSEHLVHVGAELADDHPPLRDR